MMAWKGAGAPRWTDDEEQLLVRLRQAKRRWRAIASELGRPSAGACRMHYVKVMDRQRKQAESRRPSPVLMRRCIGPDCGRPFLAKHRTNYLCRGCLTSIDETSWETSSEAPGGRTWRDRRNSA